MWQVDEVKVIALTRGGLIGGRKQCMKSAVTTNYEKSAESIVLAKTRKARTIAVYETEKGG